MAITVGPIALGKTCTVLDLSNTGTAGNKTVEASIESDSVLISLFAEVVSGTLDVTVYTLTEDGKEVAVINFPQLSAPTSELLLKKAAVVMSRIKVVATYTGDSTFEVRARGISAGETSVKLLGASTGKSSQISISTTPTLVIPVSLTDRSGIIVRNNSLSGTLYLGYQVSEATTTDGYPIGPGESLGMDIAAGVTIYGRSDSGTIDVRIMEAAF